VLSSFPLPPPQEIEGLETLEDFISFSAKISNPSNQLNTKVLF
jgi:hypothetical protein